MTKRRGTETRPDRSLPEADSGRAWELVRIAYESHFELARHYASAIFQARIAITTVMVVAVTLGFGYLPRGASDSIELAGVPARGLVVYAAALFINLLYAMEVKYLERFYRIVRSGRQIEREYHAPAYFADYERAVSWPLYFAYLGGILILLGLFLGAAWTPRQGAARAAVLVVIATLPVAAFIRSYAMLVRSGRRLLE